nr:signal peptidase I [Pleionea sediminis]
MEKKAEAKVQALYQIKTHPDEKEIEAVRKLPWWIDYGWSFFPLLLIIVLLRSFFYEPFKIPSGSMKPTLWVHDFILVNKFAYGLRLPVTKTKLTEGDAPQRGDVVVFRAPHEPEKDYIKRLIALPGDTVFYNQKHELFIIPNCDTDSARENANNAGLQCGVKNLIHRRLVSDDGFENTDVYEETIGTVTHQILVHEKDIQYGQYRYIPGWRASYEANKRVYPNLTERKFHADRGSFHYDWAKGVKVPQANYFVLGDNRTGSSDSRFWGFVPEKRMVGKAEAIWMHLEFGFEDKKNPDKGGIMSYIPTGVKFDRVQGIK